MPDPTCPLCAAPDAKPFATAFARRYFRCPACELTFLDRTLLPSAEEERRECLLHENDPADPGYRRHLAHLLDPLTARLPPGSQGLDYGCGPGPAISTILAERGFRVADWDPLFRPDPAPLARRYDFVTCTEVAEHFHHPAEEFRRLAGLLRPGGVLGLMTSLLLDGIDFPRWGYMRERGHVCFYRPATIDWIAREHGMAAEVIGGNVAVLRGV